ncbi:glutamate receptor-like [Periplaneta americana]|uniref:glutamate receptor-like n=1 Tax=Periplaneta americana TaxID=6978 RepID=UPI0037E76106
MFEDVNIPFDCEFLVAEFNGARNVILTELYRISPSFPLQRNRYGKWTPHGGLDLANDVLYSRRNNLQGLLFRTLVDKAVVNNMSDEHNYEKYRYFYQVWRELSIKMNFTIEFLPRETHGNGILLKNGSWNGVVGFLQRREANATIMSVSMTAARSRVLDFVGPIFTAKKYLIIRDTDSFETSWTSFLEPLDDSLWMVLVGTMGLLAIFVWISHRALFILKGTLQSYDVGYALLFVWGKFCNQGDSATSDFTPIRIKALTTHLTATLIIAAYSGALVSHLAVRRTQLPFNTFREFLLEGQFSLGMHKFSSLLPFFQNNTDPVIRQLYLQNVVPYLEQLPNSNMNGLRKVCSAPKYAFIYTQEYMNEVQSRLDCKLIVIPQAYISWIKSICLTKNSPYLGLFRHTLSKLRRDGVLQKLALDAQQNSPVQEPAVLSMDMVITAPVFAALSVGVAASIMSFICELAALRYFTHCRQRARGAETRNKNMSLFPA